MHAIIVDTHNIRVLHLTEHHGFSTKAFELGGSVFTRCRYELYGYWLVQAGMFTEPHGSHATFADLDQYAVTVTNLRDGRHRNTGGG